MPGGRARSTGDPGSGGGGGPPAHGRRPRPRPSLWMQPRTVCRGAPPAPWSRPRDRAHPPPPPPAAPTPPAPAGPPHHALHSSLVAARHPVVDQRLDTGLHIGSAHAVILSSTHRPKRVTRSSAGDEPSGKQRA